MRTVLIVGLSLLAATAACKSDSAKPNPAPIADVAPGGLTSVMLTPSDGALPDLLALEAGKAKAAGLRPYVELWATWCPPCKAIESTLNEPLMKAAFAGVYLVRLDIDVWAKSLLPSLDSSSIPAFYELTTDGEVIGERRIDGGAWGDNIPENMAPPLGKFFHAPQS